MLPLTATLGPRRAQSVTWQEGRPVSPAHRPGLTCGPVRAVLSFGAGSAAKAQWDRGTTSGAVVRVVVAVRLHEWGTSGQWQSWG